MKTSVKESNSGKDHGLNLSESKVVSAKRWRAGLVALGRRWSGLLPPRRRPRRFCWATTCLRPLGRPVAVPRLGRSPRVGLAVPPALVVAARVGRAGLVLAQAVLFLFLVLFFYKKQGTCKIRNKS